uniref:L-type lectin-domain containing protein n=1 Tax=Lacinutrix sp. TaxID=1937692 RepID=UPI0035C82D03
MKFKLHSKLYYTLFILIIFFTQKSQAQLMPIFVGNTIDLGNDCYQITSNANFQLGAVWYNNSIDLNADFDIVFDANFGSNDANGADGIVFVLKTSPTPEIGASGGDLGYGGIFNSLAVEFDTWQNNDRNDPFNDHVALISNGNTNHALGTSLTSPVNASAVSGNIEDGISHEIKISWRAMTQEFRVIFDCNERIFYSNDIINTVFGGNSNVFFGFTGSTGGSTNLQTICFKSISFVDEFLLDNQNICSGETINSIDATYDGATNYSWSPNTGVSDISIPNPIFSPTVNTTYTVEITDGCGEIITTSFDANITPTDDSTFTMLASCTGAVVNSVATPGGIYVFNPVPTDGALINPSNGTINNGVPGTSYTVEYTTSGTCPSTSQFSVSIGLATDSTFTMSASCDGGTATIT